MTKLLNKSLLALGIIARPQEVFLYCRSEQDLLWAESKDGIKFKLSEKTLKLIDAKSRKLNIRLSRDFRISREGKGFVMTFIYGENRKTLIASSSDLLNWKSFGQTRGLAGASVLLPDYRYHSKNIAFFGENEIKVAGSYDLLNWETMGKVVDEERSEYFDKVKFYAATAVSLPEGILLLYFSEGQNKNKSKFSLNAVLLDLQNPARVVWRSANTLWEQGEEWSGKNVSPVGAIYFQNKIISYWNVADEGIFDIVHAPVTHLFAERKGTRFGILHRLIDNPILKPLADRYWESRATFNPTAVTDRGKVHLIYRAIGDDDVSVLGYASSFDGKHIDERLKEPMYEPTEEFELTGIRASFKSAFMSGGGGYGGTEDPRITKIGRRFYLTYVAYNGWAPPRVALTSISEEDFHAKNWKFEKSVLISPPNVVDKNACLFPEKIGGKYVFLHRIFPNILIDFIDELDVFDGETYLKGEYKISPRRRSWDSRKIGAGAPPLKTPYGWLLIYHAVGDNDPGRYKVGAMLLDLNDPTKVIARSRVPILTPEVSYENEGYKSGVVYPCGAVIMGDELLVYYGGADMVTCVASVKFSELLANLLAESSSEFRTAFQTLT